MDQFLQSPCILWQGVKNPQGYGICRVDGKRRVASRLALEKKLGRQIRPGYQACHHCDNPPCVNPEHLFEGTQKDNIADAIAKGRLKLVQPPALTPEQIAQVSSRLCAGERGVDLAKEFGVSRSVISHLCSKLGLRGRGGLLNVEQVKEIKALLVAGVSGKEIARRYDIKFSTVSCIKHGVNWSDVGDPLNLPKARRQKLTDEQIREIKRLLGEGVGVLAIARQFGVTHALIGKIKRGEIHRQIV